MRFIALWLDAQRFPQMVREIWREHDKGRTEAEIIEHLERKYAEEDVLTVLRWLDGMPRLRDFSRMRKALELSLWLLAGLYVVVLYLGPEPAVGAGADSLGPALTLILVVAAGVLYYLQTAVSYIAIMVLLLLGYLVSPLPVASVFSIPVDLIGWMRDALVVVLFAAAMVDAVLLQARFGGSLRVRSILRRSRLLK